MGIPIEAFRAGIVRASHLPNTEARMAYYEILLEQNPDWDFDDAMAFVEKGRPLTPAEKRSLAATREFFGNEYSG